MLEVSEDAVRVVDLSSTNGTFIDGEELQAGVAYALDENGEVVFGDEFLACYQLVKADLEPPIRPIAPTHSYSSLPRRVPALHRPHDAVAVHAPLHDLRRAVELVLERDADRGELPPRVNARVRVQAQRLLAVIRRLSPQPRAAAAILVERAQRQRRAQRRERARLHAPVALIHAQPPRRPARAGADARVRVTEPDDDVRVERRRRDAAGVELERGRRGRRLGDDRGDARISAV
eukprot:31562-Pelagococcus_subviridis.AAC.11